MINVLLKMMDFLVKLMDFVLNMVDFLAKLMDFVRTGAFGRQKKAAQSLQSSSFLMKMQFSFLIQNSSFLTHSASAPRRRGTSALAAAVALPLLLLAHRFLLLSQLTMIPCTLRLNPLPQRIAIITQNGCVIY